MFNKRFEQNASQLKDSCSKRNQLVPPFMLGSARRGQLQVEQIQKNERRIVQKILHERKDMRGKNESPGRESPTKHSSAAAFGVGGQSFELKRGESLMSGFSGSEKDLDIYMLPIIDIEEPD